MTRVFFDMDGVLARYRDVPYGRLLEEGYFLHLEPQEEVLEAAVRLSEDPRFMVAVISAVIPESRTAVEEKREWLAMHFPEGCGITGYFVPCGMSKAEAVPGGILPTDILIDDHNANLMEWSGKAVAVKLLNGMNDRRGSWKGYRVRSNADEITAFIHAIAERKENYGYREEQD